MGPYGTPDGIIDQVEVVRLWQLFALCGSGNSYTIQVGYQRCQNDTTSAVVDHVILCQMP